MKNQRGVTLIALVVTIIVLIILAGVAIAALTGDNGLITRSRESKKLQIEGEVRDEITLAIAAAKAFAENESTASAGFNAAADLAKGTDASTGSLVYKEIVKDLTAAKGFTVSPSSGSITISYTTTAYQQACNNTAANSTISVTVTVSRNNFTVGTYSYGTYQA